MKATLPINSKKTLIAIGLASILSSGAFGATNPCVTTADADGCMSVDSGTGVSITPAPTPNTGSGFVKGDSTTDVTKDGEKSADKNFYLKTDSDLTFKITNTTNKDFVLNLSGATLNLFGKPADATTTPTVKTLIFDGDDKTADTEKFKPTINTKDSKIVGNIKITKKAEASLTFDGGIDTAIDAEGKDKKSVAMQGDLIVDGEGVLTAKFKGGAFMKGDFKTEGTSKKGVINATFEDGGLIGSINIDSQEKSTFTFGVTKADGVEGKTAHMQGDISIASGAATSVTEILAASFLNGSTMAGSIEGKDKNAKATIIFKSKDGVTEDIVSLTGDIKGKGELGVTFESGTSMKGNIESITDGKHSVTFKKGNLEGSITATTDTFVDATKGITAVFNDGKMTGGINTSTDTADKGNIEVTFKKGGLYGDINAINGKVTATFGDSTSATKTSAVMEGNINLLTKEISTTITGASAVHTSRIDFKELSSLKGDITVGASGKHSDNKLYASSSTITFSKDSSTGTSALGKGAGDDNVVMEGVIYTVFTKDAGVTDTATGKGTHAITFGDGTSMKGIVRNSEDMLGSTFSVNFAKGSLYGTYEGGNTGTAEVEALKLDDGFIDAVSFKSFQHKSPDGKSYDNLEFGNKAIEIKGGKHKITIKNGGVKGDVITSGTGSELKIVGDGTVAQALTLSDGDIKASSSGKNTITVEANKSKAHIISNVTSESEGINTITLESGGSFGSAEKRSLLTAMNGSATKNELTLKNVKGDVSYISMMTKGGENNFTLEEDTTTRGTSYTANKYVLDIDKISNAGITSVTLKAKDSGLKIGNIENTEGELKITTTKAVVDIDSIRSSGSSKIDILSGNNTLESGNMTIKKLSHINDNTIGVSTNIGLKSNSTLSIESIDYSNGAVNVLFGANLTSNGTGTSIQDNKIQGFEFKDGIKISLATTGINGGESAFGGKTTKLDLRKNETSKTITATWTGGRVIGSIIGLAKNTGDADMVLRNVFDGSAFLGTIEKGTNSKIKQVDVDLKNNAKLILTNSKTGSGLVDIKFDNLSVGNNTRPLLNTIKTSSFSDSGVIIDLASDGNDLGQLKRRDYFRTLSIGDSTSANGLSGSGAIFRVYMDAYADKEISGIYVSSEGSVTGMSDVIKIEGVKSDARGKTQYIQIQQAVGSVATEDLTNKNIVVAMVREGATQDKMKFESLQSESGFITTNFELDTDRVKVDGTGAVTIGGTTDNTHTRYKIGKAQAKINEETAKGAESAIGLGYGIFMSNINSLNKRMGELRENNNSHGIWARVFGGSETSNVTALEVTSKYTTFQAGYDYSMGAVGANNYIGFAVGYGMLDSKTADVKNVPAGLSQFSSKSNNIEFGIYNSYVSDSGFYTDSIAKFATISSSLTPNDTNIKVSDISNLGLSVSQEIGYRINMANKSFYIDPQAELSLGYLSASDLKALNGAQELKANGDSIFALRTRVGAAAGYQLRTNSGFQADFRIGGAYVYDHTSGGDVNVVVGHMSTESFNAPQDHRFVMNVGTNIKAGENTRIYVDFEKSFGGKVNTDYLVNAGLRFSFGESSYSLADTKVANEVSEQVATKGIYVEVLSKKGKLTLKQKELLKNHDYKVQNKDGSKSYLIGSYTDKNQANDAMQTLSGLAEKLGGEAVVVEVE